MKAQFVLFAVLLSLVSYVAGACCGADNKNLCGDNTAGTPCCGYGKCNIFCCACKGGCRHSFTSTMDELLHGGGAAHSFEQVEEEAAVCLEKFSAADANGDGKVTFLEWVRSPSAASLDSLPVVAAHWEKFDVEGKGYLTEEEALLRLA